MVIFKHCKIFLADSPRVFIIILKDISVAAFKKLPGDDIKNSTTAQHGDAFGKTTTGEVFSHSKDVEKEFTM